MASSRLAALGFPAAAAGGALPAQLQARAVDRAALATLTAWLEDVKIRALPVQQRNTLRAGAAAGAEGPQWEAALAAYLKEIQCPYEASYASQSDESRYVLANWLLTAAVAYEYTDEAAAFNAAAARPAATREEQFAGVGTAEARAAAEALAAALEVPVREGATTEALLQGCARAAERLRAAGSSSSGSVSSDADPLKDYPLGFGTGDAAVDRAATALRCLFINDLRALQTAVDRLLVAVQERTANPRTDAKRGKVGR